MIKTKQKHLWWASESE